MFERVGMCYLKSLLDDYRELLSEEGGVEAIHEPIPEMDDQEKDALMAFLEREGFSAVDRGSHIIVWKEDQVVTKHQFDEEAFKSALWKLGYRFFLHAKDVFIEELASAFDEGKAEAVSRLWYEEFFDPETIKEFNKFVAKQVQEELKKEGYMVEVKPLRRVIGVKGVQLQLSPITS